MFLRHKCSSAKPSGIKRQSDHPRKLQRVGVVASNNSVGFRHPTSLWNQKCVYSILLRVELHIYLMQQTYSQTCGNTPITLAIKFPFFWIRNWNSPFNIPFTTKAFILILGGGSEVNSCKVCGGSDFVWILQVCTIVSTQPEVVIMVND